MSVSLRFKTTVFATATVLTCVAGAGQQKPTIFVYGDSNTSAGSTNPRRRLFHVCPLMKPGPIS